MQRTLESCWFCYDSPKLERNLIAALGNHAYLALPKRGSISPGHCLIVPMQHVTSLANADESIWEEILVIIQSILTSYLSI